jgi:hypothetical protein
MARASVQRNRVGQALALSLGLVVVGGFWLMPNPVVLAKEPSKPAPGKPGDDKKVTVTPGSYAAVQQTRVINEQIEAQWKENKLTPSRRASDLEFIRRASLDIIGRIPKLQEIKDFLKDPQQTRRAQLIDRLLESEEYAKNWANLWTVWLLTRSGPELYHEEMQVWLEEQFAKNRGWDRVVTDLLTATGENSDNGAVNFILSHLGETIKDKTDEGRFELVPVTSRTTRLFLGLQTQCTQCHDHPFNSQWKQKHFWGVNAFFRQVERKGTPAMARNAPPAKLSLLDNPNLNPDGAVFYDNRKALVQMTKAVFLEPDPKGNPQKWDKAAPTTRRQQLAQFITASPYFSKAFINRMWGHFFGRGFTNPGPVDDFGDHNPVTHPLPEGSPLIEDLKRYGNNPTLLDYLANEFTRYKHSPRDLIRWICNSEPYQLSSVANKTNDKADAEPFFSRMLLKSMSPEQLFESLMVATQSAASQDKEARKKLRQEWMRKLIVNFGDDEGNEVTFNGTIVQALILMNGKEINDAIADKDTGTVARTIYRKGATVKSVLDDLFLASVNRYPTAAEYKALNDEINLVRSGRVKNKDVNALYQDVFWALLNSNEFLLNH